MAFDPDKYLEKKEAFNPDACLTNKALAGDIYSEPKETEALASGIPGEQELKSFGLGAAQGASFNTADELLAALKSQAISGPEYEQELQSARQMFKKAQEESPLAYSAGDIGGGVATGLLVPGSTSASLGKMALSGAGQAALASLGGTEKQLTDQDQALEALKEAVPAATLGAAGGAIGKLLQSTRALPEKSEKIADLLKAFKLGQEGQDIATKAGKKAVSQEMYGLGKGLQEGLEQTEEELGKKYGSILKEAKGLNIKEPVSKISKENLEELLSEQTDPSRQKEVQKLIEKIENLKKQPIEKGFSESGEAIIKDREFINPQMLKNFIEDVKSKSYLERPDSGFKALTGEATGLAQKAQETLLESTPGLKDVNDKLAATKQALDILGRTSSITEDKAKMDTIKRYSELLASLTKKGISGEGAEESIKAVQNVIQNVPEAKQIVDLLEKSKDVAEKYKLAGISAKEGLTGIEKILGSFEGKFVSGANLVGQSPLAKPIELTSKAVTSEMASQVPGSVTRSSMGRDVYGVPKEISENDIKNAYVNLGDDEESNRIREEIELVERSDPKKRAALKFKLSQNPKFREAMAK